MKKFLLITVFAIVSLVKLFAQDNWIKIEANGFNNDEHFNGFAYHKGTLFTASSFVETGSINVRWSTNGLNWNTSNFPANLVSDLTAIASSNEAGGYLYAGGTDISGNIIIYYTTDSTGNNWTQMDTVGQITAGNSLSRIFVFKGTGNVDSIYAVSGTKIWRSVYNNNGTQPWDLVLDASTLDTNAQNITDFCLHNGMLYVTTDGGYYDWGNSLSVTGGSVLYTADGLNWQRDTSIAIGLGNTNTFKLTAIESFNGKLYIAGDNHSFSYDEGAVLAQYNPADSIITYITTNGFGLNADHAIISDIYSAYGNVWVSVNGAIGGGGRRPGSPSNGTLAINDTPSEIFKSSDGSTFIASNSNGFGLQNNFGSNAKFQMFNDMLFYSATKNYGPGIIYSLCVTGTEPVVNLGPDTLVCSGTGVVLDAGNPGADYSWLDVTYNTIYTTQTITANHSGDYQITVSNGCIASDIIKISHVQNPTLSAPDMSTVCYGDTIQLNLSGIANYDGPLASGLDSNVYFITDTNPSGIYGQINISGIPGVYASEIVSVTIDSLMHTYDGDLTIELMAPDGSSIVLSGGHGGGDDNFLHTVFSKDAAIPVANGAAPFTGEFTPDAPFYNLTGLAEGLWQLHITDNVGGDDGNLYKWSMVIQSPYGPITYSWSSASYLNSDTGASVYISPNYGTNVYYCSAANNFGCVTSDSVVIWTPLLTSGSSVAAICKGDSLRVFANVDMTGMFGGGQARGTGFADYNWVSDSTLAGTNGDTLWAFPVDTTIYHVSTFVNGCTLFDSVTVIVYPTTPDVFAGNDTGLCAGTSFQLSAVNSESYVWQPALSVSDSAIANPFVDISSSGYSTYYVRGADVYGCYSYDTITVFVMETPAAMAGNDIAFCEGGSAVLNGTTSGADLSYWNNDPSLADSSNLSSVVSPVTTIAYVLNAVNTSNGCIVNDTVVVTVNLKPTFTPLADITNCGPDTFQLNTNANAAIISWTPAAEINDPAAANPLVYPLTSTNYTVYMESPEGCVSYDTASITILDQPTANAGTDNAICAGSISTLTGTVVADNFSWTSTDNSMDNPLALTVNSTPAVSVEYTLHVSNNNGCTGSDIVLVTVNANPTITSLADISNCGMGTFNLNTNSNATTFVWAPNTDISDNTIANPDVFPAATTTYTVVASNVDGCYAYDTVTVNILTQPTVDAGVDNAICEGSFAMLSGVANADSYSWTSSDTSISDPLSLSPTVTPALSSEYTLHAYNNNGCADSDMVYITINNSPVIDAGNNVALCTGSITQLNATGAITYSWMPAQDLSATDISNPVCTPTNSITYSVIGIAANGCSGLDTVRVTANAYPVGLGVVQFDSLGTLVSLTSGVVSVYASDSLGYLSVLSQTSVVNGAFMFSNLPEGNITFLSSPDSAVYYPSLSPMYDNGAITWDSIQTTNAVCGDTVYRNIIHPYLAPLSGMGVISGFIYKPFGRRPGEPVIGVDVSVEQIPGGMQAFRTTDTTGYFEFTGLNDGVYQILVNVPGHLMDSTHIVTIDTDGGTTTDLEPDNIYFVNDTLIFIDDILSGGIAKKISDKPSDMGILQVYPNPVSSYSLINFSLITNEPAKLELVNLVGQTLVLDQNASETGAYSYPLVPEKLNLSAGIYFVRLTQGSNSQQVKIVVK